MRLASLFSGGKDSAFALYLAQQMGHDVVCLVNITSKNGESWMFHTPNAHVVPMMSECLGIPLKTAETDGTESGDLSALKNALEGLDVEGVIAGTIQSDYQWDRMNRISEEMNLKLIAPLWRKDQDMLFDEMTASGIDAIVVGTFAEGLDEKWLGRKLDSDAKKDLLSVRKKHSVSIMGEGGEYESMVLDSPSFSKRLDVVSFETKRSKNSSAMTVKEAAVTGK